MIPGTAAPAAQIGAPPSARAGLLLAALVLCVYGGLAVGVNFPRAAIGIQSDEATYYMMGHSLVRDGDLTYRREDLVRVWKEFDSGPSGVFLKRGSDVLDAGLMLKPPFFWLRTQPDPDRSRLFYGKSYIYPVFAAPFVMVFGTNGFLVLHAVLLALVIWCAFLFLHAQMRAAVAALLAGAFVMVTVVPVYFVWITPELFNFALGVFAYFCWLYKEVAPREHVGRRMQWLLDGRSDLIAAVLLGIATFSKLWSALLFPPLALYLIWRRNIRRATVASALFSIVTAALFAINVAISGEWNYQGGSRAPFYHEFPFQTPASEFDTLVSGIHGRDDVMTDVIFNPSVVWTNFIHNLKWFFIGRHAGLVPYYFPAVFALVAFALSRSGRSGWRYFALLGGVGQILVMIVGVPYTWNGGGGSVGNRYFMGAYGAFLFLLSPLTRMSTALVPWIVGGLFMAPLVLNPFVTSFKPGDHTKSGPFRLLPIELTLVNDWPINNDPLRVRQWFGDNPPEHKDPGFQIYFLDDNAFIDKADRSFWVKGVARAELLIKTDRPMKRLVLQLIAGPEPVDVEAELSGRSQTVTLGPGDSQQLTFAMGDGFPYQGRWPVWTASISASTGFVPIFHGDAKDTRFLGVRVKPMLVE